MEYLSTQCASQSVGPANQLVSLLVQTLLSSYCSISNSDKWPKDYGTEALLNGLDEYDFVVIGAGSAGSVIANRLSENPEWKVLLLEAGGDPPIESEIPLWFFTMQHTEADWQYFTKPNGKSCSASNNGSCFWPRGKMLGGSSGINAMLYVRGNRRDFDNWEANGNPTWGWDDVLKYFKKSENIQTKLPLNTNEHGSDGLLSVSHFPGENDETTEMIFDAAKEYGYNHVNDFSESEGFTGYTNVLGTTVNNRRVSTAKAFLVSAKDRPNLHVIKHAHVKKIIFDDDNKSVTGVEFVYKSENNMIVKVKKEAILSAGAIGTPQILLLSGIGPKKHLKKIGIPVIHNSDVGKNLKDHAIVPLFFKLRESRPKSMNPKQALAEFYKFLMNEDSIFSSIGTARLIGFVNTLDPKGTYPDIEYHHINSMKNAPDLDLILKISGYNSIIVDHLHKINEKAEILIVWTVLLNPKSTGNVKLSSTDYRDYPIIEPNYFDKKDDVEAMLRGVKFQVSFENTKTFKENEAELIKLPLPDCNDLKFKSDEYWKCYIKFMSGTVYHPTSTAKMGPDTDKKAVVDPELRVYGVQNLRVADASIMPDIVSGNTNAATIMIGEKLVDFVKDKWNGKKNKKSKKHSEL